MEPEVNEELTQNEHGNEASEKPIEGFPTRLNEALILVMPGFRPHILL
jgi:hypothetical protein